MAMDFKGLGVCRRVSASVSVCLSLRSVVTWVKHKEKNVVHRCLGFLGDLRVSHLAKKYIVAFGKCPLPESTSGIKMMGSKEGDLLGKWGN